MLESECENVELEAGMRVHSSGSFDFYSELQYDCQADWTDWTEFKNVELKYS